MLWYQSQTNTPKNYREVPLKNNAKILGGGGSKSNSAVYLKYYIHDQVGFISGMHSKSDKCNISHEQDEGER